MMDTTFKTGTGFLKWMTAEKLISILSKLEPGDEISCNDVGNLTVYREKKYFAWIDFNFEELETRDQNE